MLASKVHQVVTDVNEGVWVLHVVDILTEWFHRGSVGCEIGVSASVTVLREMTMSVTFYTVGMTCQLRHKLAFTNTHDHKMTQGRPVEHSIATQFLLKIRSFKLFLFFRIE